MDKKGNVEKLITEEITCVICNSVNIFEREEKRKVALARCEGCQSAFHIDYEDRYVIATIKTGFDGNVFWA